MSKDVLEFNFILFPLIALHGLLAFFAINKEHSVQSSVSIPDACIQNANSSQGGENSSHAIWISVLVWLFFLH